MPIDFAKIEWALKAVIYEEQALSDETTLSLPVLTGAGDNLRIVFFLYVVGGPSDDRKIFPPTRKVSLSPGYPDSGTYSIEHFDGGIPVPPEFPIGQSISSISWEEFELKRQQYDKLLVQLFYAWQAGVCDVSIREQQTVFRRIFDELVDAPLRPAYASLNPDLFDWLWRD